MGSLYHHPTSDKTEGKTEKHQKGAKDCCSKHLRKNKETRRIDPHHIHGINLFGNTHAAYFRSNVRPHLSCKNQRDHGRAELQDKAFPDHIADVHLINDRIFKV